MGKVYFHKLALTLIIAGALNWGLVAFNINFVKLISDYINKFIGTNIDIEKICI